MKEPIIIPKKGAVNLLYLAGALVFTGLCLVFSFSSFSYLPSGHQTLMAVLKPILFFGIFSLDCAVTIMPKGFFKIGLFY